MISNEGFALNLPLWTYPQTPFCIHQIRISKEYDHWAEFEAEFRYLSAGDIP